MSERICARLWEFGGPHSFCGGGFSALILVRVAEPHLRREAEGAWLRDATRRLLGAAVSSACAQRSMPSQPFSRPSRSATRSTTSSAERSESSDACAETLALRCDRCGKPGHDAVHCAHFPRARCCGHADAAQPDAAELARNRAESEAPDVTIAATVEKMNGSGLSCFFLTVVAGLARLGVARAPPSVPALRRAISVFLLSAEAASTWCTSEGTTLKQAAQEEGLTLRDMAASVRQSGTEEGMGGTLLSAAVTALYKVDFLTFQRAGSGRFKLQVVSSHRCHARRTQRCTQQAKQGLKAPKAEQGRCTKPGTERLRQASAWGSLTWPGGGDSGLRPATDSMWCAVQCVMCW